MAQIPTMETAAAENKPDRVEPPPPAPKKRDWSWISEDRLNETRPCAAEDGKVLLPGFGRPVNDMLEERRYGYQHRDKINLYNRFPNALQEWSPEPLTVRERNMMQVINAITDKPDWRRKVFEETIIAKWRAEAVTEEGQGFTEKMFDYVSFVPSNTPLQSDSLTDTVSGRTSRQGWSTQRRQLDCRARLGVGCSQVRQHYLYRAEGRTQERCCSSRRCPGKPQGLAPWFQSTGP